MKHAKADIETCLGIDVKRNRIDRRSQNRPQQQQQQRQQQTPFAITTSTTSYLI